MENSYFRNIKEQKKKQNKTKTYFALYQIFYVSFLTLVTPRTLYYDPYTYIYNVMVRAN